MSQLRDLLNLITRSVDALEKSCEESGTRIPDLHESFHPSSEAFRKSPVAQEAASTICAAAAQMNAILATPMASFFDFAGGHGKSAAARMCLESHVTEILREAGPEGMHVRDIAAKARVDAAKLGSCLRMLATHHIYRELKPDVFTNTRISSMVDTFKASEDIIANPENKFDGTNGLAACACHILDDHFKSASYQWETVNDLGAPDTASFAKAIGNGLSFWEYNSKPENAYIRRRFDIAMLGAQAMQTNESTLTGFDWKSLPDDALVVDVGGGIGAASLALAKEYPNIRIIIQDRAAVIQNGMKVWSKELPDALASGRVKFQEHNFFEPQPHVGASVFFIKNILHDWSDELCVKILKMLREAASHDTKLIVVDAIVPYACHDLKGTRVIPGSTPREAPAPLLPNWGIVNHAVYGMDIGMMVFFNAQERTVYHLDQVLQSAGWKIAAIHRTTAIEATTLAAIEAIPS